MGSDSLDVWDIFWISEQKPKLYPPIPSHFRAFFYENHKALPALLGRSNNFLKMHAGE